MQNQCNQATLLNTPDNLQESFEYPRGHYSLSGSVPPKAGPILIQQPHHQTIQAFWRVLQQGNAHWQSYWNDDTVPIGTNDKPCTTGCIDSKGKDRTYNAGAVWCWTKETVDKYKKSWGPWSIGPDQTRHWICMDLEPKLGTKKITSPTQTICIEEATYAITAYNSWLAQVEIIPEICCLALIETSIAHNHLWVLLDRRVSVNRHNEILSIFYSGFKKDMRYQCKDTSITVHQDSKGTHFRAPWCWKNGQEILAVEFWCRDENELILIGESLKPTSLKTKFTKTSKASDDPVAFYTAIAIRDYPWHPSTDLIGGNRHDQRSRLILSMLDRKVPVEILKQVGANWLKHYDDKDASTARMARITTDFDNCVVSTANTMVKNNHRNYTTKSSEEYLVLEKSLIVPFNLRELLNEIGNSNNLTEDKTRDNTLPLKSFLRGKVLSRVGVASTSVTTATIQASSENSECKKVSYNEKLLDSFIVLCAVEYAKSTYDGVLGFIYKQVVDVMEVRWGARGREDKFADYVKRFAVLSGNKPDYPILERTVKGVPGYDSKYKPKDVFEKVLIEVVKGNESLLSAFFSPHVAVSPVPALQPEYQREKPTRAKETTTVRKKQGPASSKQTARKLQNLVELLSLANVDDDTVDSMLADVEDHARSGEL